MRPTNSRVTRERISSRSGAPTVRVDGIFLHSGYDPRREAHRQLTTLNLTERSPRTVVVIGEGIPYLSEAIAAQFPEISVFAAILGEPSLDFDVPQIDLTDPPAGGLRGWLRNRVVPLDAAALELVPWEAGRRLAPELVAQAEREALEVVQNASAEIATIGSFGRRWLANALRSAILVDDRWEIPYPGMTATLATSGPSLEQLLPAGRSGFPGMLTSTSSAWFTLTQFDITPEMVVHTDGGYWATRYLQSAHAYRDHLAPVVAMPAHAAVPVSLLRSAHRHRFGFLSTGWLGEALHVDQTEWRRVPDAPTVTATALQLLHGLRPTGRIYVAGLDLMSRGVVGHARPHPNDRVIATAAHRLRPEISIRAERTLAGKATREEWRDGVMGYRSPALEAFLPEIDRILTLHRTSGSIEPLPIPPVSGSPTKSAPPERDTQNADSSSPPPPRTYRRAPRSQRIEHARRVLDTWRATATEGPWDPIQREILFHLAPVEVLQTLRGERDQSAVAAAAHVGLDTLTQLLNRIS
mgnify:CR=1 FL=1